MIDIDPQLARTILPHGALRDRWDWIVRAPEVDDGPLPGRLHFIWLGSPLPDKYRSNIEGFVEKNPFLDVSLWTDRAQDDIDGVRRRSLDASELENRDLFAAETNLGAKADIARYEIVREEGGVYYDVDSVCVRPLDALFERAWVTAELVKWRNITNAMFGAVPNSRFLDFVVRALRFNAKKHRPEVPDRTGPTFFTTCYLAYDDPKIRLIEQSSVNPLAETPDCVTYHTCDHNWRDR